MPRAGSRRWRRIVAVALVASALVAIAYSRGRAPRPEPTIRDRAFVAAANQRCAATLPRLRATRDTVRSEDSREQETADAIERASAGVDALVAELRALPVATGDEDEVDAWLDAWARYTAAGRRYAAAIRTGDPTRYGRVDDESVAPLRAISRFSRANRIDACVP